MFSEFAKLITFDVQLVIHSPGEGGGWRGWATFAPVLFIIVRTVRMIPTMVEIFDDPIALQSRRVNF